MKKIYLLIFMMVFLCLSSCADAMPDEYLVDNTEVEEEIDYGIIDDSLYTPSESMVYSMRQPLFVNLPGMVLLNDQEAHNGAVHLTYVNKANTTEYFFCFDALCNHGDCIGGYGGAFLFVENWIWFSGTQQLYATARPPSELNLMASSDGNLYQIDIDTQEYQLVYRGNGSEILAIYANEKYIYLRRMNADGQMDIVRFHPKSGKAKTMVPPTGRKFSALIVSGDTILVNFTDEYGQMYQTDERFSYYEPIYVPMQPIYMDQETVYYSESTTGISVGWGVSARSICSYNLDTKEKRNIFTYDGEDHCVRVVGYGGGYIYYLLNPLRGGTYVHPGRILYRVPIEGGESEPMVNFGKDHTGLDYELFVDMVAVYDGTIYCHLKTDANGPFVDRYGTLTQDQDGVWAFRKLPVGDE
ncbi:MAG: DUF5050 domain-containing protein [Clostridia bacterium]|nr:DUF5050 domain-containing protein [Clostridia bacterium]